MTESIRFANGEYSSELLEVLLDGDCNHFLFDFIFRLVIADIVKAFGWTFHQIPPWFIREFVTQYLDHLPIIKQKYITSRIVGRMHRGKDNQSQYDEAPIKSRV